MADHPRDTLLRESVWHGSLDRAEAILAAYPEIASSDIYVAALLGDDAAVRRFLALDPANATAKGGPLGWDALTYLCFSNYLRLDASRSDGFVRAATALLLQDNKLHLELVLPADLTLSAKKSARKPAAVKRKQVA